MPPHLFVTDKLSLSIPIQRYTPANRRAKRSLCPSPGIQTRYQSIYAPPTRLARLMRDKHCHIVYPIDFRNRSQVRRKTLLRCIYVLDPHDNV